MGLDPIPIAAEMVQALQLIVSRQIDGRQPRVLTIGRIQGGTRFNIIADQVTMEGTIRTHDAGVRALIKERMARTVEHVAAAHGTTARLSFYDEGNPPTVNDAGLAALAVPVLGRVFGAGAVRVPPQMVAEDFPFYGRKAPYFYFLLGSRNDARGIASTNHTATFDIDEASLPLGVRALATLAWEFNAGGLPAAAANPAAEVR
jgi:amidohydrolase